RESMRKASEGLFVAAMRSTLVRVLFRTREVPAGGPGPGRRNPPRTRGSGARTAAGESRSGASISAVRGAERSDTPATPRTARRGPPAFGSAVRGEGVPQRRGDGGLGPPGGPEERPEAEDAVEAVVDPDRGGRHAGRRQRPRVGLALVAQRVEVGGEHQGRRQALQRAGEQRRAARVRRVGGG